MPPKPRRTGIVVLSILTALFLVTTGVFATLFITRTSQANEMADQVTTLSAQNNATSTKANNLQKDLDAAKRDLDDAKSKNDEATRQRTVLADCLNAIIDENKAFAASHGVETADVKAKENVTDQKCDAASHLL
jgi:chromosome segregation ATPase